MKRRSTMALALAFALLLAACGAPPAPAAETGAAPAQTAATTPEPVSDWQSEDRAYKQSPVNTGADSTFDIFGLGADYYATAMFFGTDGQLWMAGCVWHDLDSQKRFVCLPLGSLSRFWGK